MKCLEHEMQHAGGGVLDEGCMGEILTMVGGVGAWSRWARASKTSLSKSIGSESSQSAELLCNVRIRAGRLAGWLIRLRLRQADWSGSGSDRLIDQPWRKSTGENLVRTSKKWKRCVEECIEDTKRVVLLPSTIQAIQDLPPLSKI